MIANLVINFEEPHTVLLTIGKMWYSRFLEQIHLALLRL